MLLRCSHGRRPKRLPQPVLSILHHVVADTGSERARLYISCRGRYMIPGSLSHLHPWAISFINCRFHNARCSPYNGCWQIAQQVIAMREGIQGFSECVHEYCREAGPQ